MPHSLSVMVRRFIPATIIMLLSPLCLRAQKTNVSGYITDSSSGETLIGAGVVFSDSVQTTGAVSNSYGYYSLTLSKTSHLPGGKVSVQYSYVGYEPQVVQIPFGKDTVVNVRLIPSATIGEAVVVADSKDAGIRSSFLGSLDVPVDKIRNAPVLLGEPDILKALQLLPGVQGGTEGFAGLYVRGGGPDENLVLLDGSPIYNIDHMLGLFSVFQSEAVKKVTLYKGSFPARYSGRVSSVVDIRTNDGNMKETHGSASIGVVSDRLHIEGPIIKDRLSYSLSARGMHTALYAPIIRHFLKDEYYNYYFYDLNGKLSWRINDNDRLYFGVYNGRDKFVYDESDTYKLKEERTEYWTNDGVNLSWGNSLATLRWNHIYSGRLFSNATIAYNAYGMKMGNTSHTEERYEGYTAKDSYDVTYSSGIRDLSAKLDFDFIPSPSHSVKFGAGYTYHYFRPENLTQVTQEVYSETAPVDTTFNLIESKGYRGHEVSLYAEDDLKVGDHLSLNGGLHAALFSTSGKGYFSLQPRLSARYLFDNSLSVKAGYARMAQYVHLLSSSRVSLPLDLWVPITKDIKPVTSDQFTLGFYYEGLPGWEFSLEGYWKEMYDILEYKDGTIVLGSSGGWEDKVEMGRGRAKGVELFAQKKTGKTTGWLSYALAWSDRWFPSGTINNGEKFPYKYDRRHTVNLYVTHKLTKKTDLNASWTFSTGGTTTLPTRWTMVLVDGDSYNQYTTTADYVSSRNNFRLPPSHLLNVDVQFHFFHKRGTEGILQVGAYNVYNSMNPNFLFTDIYSEKDSVTGKVKDRMVIKKVTILPIVPSVSYTLNF